MYIDELGYDRMKHFHAHFSKQEYTLSGGESQRIKLAYFLSLNDASTSRSKQQRILFIFDEPTTGLHTDDVKRLIAVLDRIVDTGNTVIVIEHNLDVIKCADWVIDLGPEGVDNGGTVITEGTPEQVAETEESWTGQYLKKVLNRGKEQQNN